MILSLPTEFITEKHLNPAEALLLCYIKDKVNSEGHFTDTDLEIEKTIGINRGSIPTLISKLQKSIFIELINNSTGRTIRYIPVPTDYTPDSKKGFIYIAADTSLPQYLKIGYSSKPADREATLQAQKPTIKFLKKFIGSRDQEQAVHRYLSKFRVRGEWFEISLEQAEAAIRKIIGI